MEERKNRKKQGTGEGEASKKLEYVSHPFEPVFDKESRVLILGSIPSPKSRENGFYYGHPRNRFWPGTRRAGASDGGGKACNGAAPPCGVVGCAGGL